MATEDEVLEAFVKGLREFFTPLEISQVRRQSRLGGKGPPYDLALDVKVAGKTKRLLCEVKAVGEPRYLYQAIAALHLAVKGERRAYPVVIAPYISPEGQRICKEANIGFIDLAGNAFLKFDGVLIERTGKAVPRQAKAVLRRLFSPKASRILRAFLENAGRSWTLAQLAEEVHVSLRTAYLVVNTLAEKGYVEKRRGAIALLNPGELLDLWAQHYTVDLNRQQTYYTFTRSHREFFEKLAAGARRHRFRYALTLHSGASLVAPFIRFTDIHFYFTGELEALIASLDLRPVERGGTVHVLTPYDEGVFYHVQEIDGVQVVCPTQLYLDLVNYPARGKEQAEFLRRQTMPF